MLASPPDATWKRAGIENAPIACGFIEAGESVPYFRIQMSEKE
jgi:hypothetical protein